MAYKDTPYPATSISPYQAVMDRPVSTKLEYTVPLKETEKHPRWSDG